MRLQMLRANVYVLLQNYEIVKYDDQRAKYRKDTLRKKNNITCIDC